MNLQTSSRPDKPVVLLVEDDADLLEMAELILQTEGFPVITASTGQRALARLDVVTPDVIITDLMMPELDGLEFIQEYSRRPGHHAPIVAVSSFQPYLENAKELGAVRTLAKPYDPQQLVRAALEVVDVEAPEQEVPTSPDRSDEEARLRAVLDLHLENPSPELELQRFLDEVAEIYQVPIAGISAVTRDQQRLVIQCSTGDPDTGGPREHSFCTHAVAARSALVVQDTLHNPLFRHNPSVSERGFRFYAGVPLISTSGESVGTLCILDFEPHPFTSTDLELLGVLAQRVLAAFDLRHQRMHPEIEDSAYRYLHCLDEQLGTYAKAVFTDLVALEATRAVQTGEPAALVGLSLPAEDLKNTADSLRDVITGGLVGRLGPSQLAAVVRDVRLAEACALARQAAPCALQMAATDLQRYQGASGQALHEIEQALNAGEAAGEMTRYPQHP